MVKPLITFLILTCAIYGFGADSDSMTLDELSNTEVFSISRQPQSIMQLAASIYVLSGEDIIRSGVSTIPDALRLVPGLQVAQIDGNKWAVSCRSLNDYPSNELLVLIDGRRIYSSLYSGVNWDTQDIILEDIDRIEIIKGPGGAVWGSDAVNGVINIITKNALDIKGILATFQVGNRGLISAVRQTVSLSDNSALKVFAKANNFYKTADGDVKAHDSADAIRSGFRYDLKNLEQTLSLTGNIFAGKYDSAYKTFDNASPSFSPDNATANYSGGDIMVNFQDNISAQNTFKANAYYTYINLNDKLINDKRSVINVDFSDDFYLNRLNHMSIGGGFRNTVGFAKDENMLSFEKNHVNENIYNMYFQDDFSAIPSKLILTFGSKLEYSEHYGFLSMPSLKTLYAVDDDKAIWGAVSYGKRLPSLAERYGIFKLGIAESNSQPVGLYTQGNNNLDPIDVKSYEVGYKVSATDMVYYELTGFYTKYKNLTSLDENNLIPDHTADGSLILFAPVTNGIDYDTYGFEGNISYSPVQNLKLGAWYAYSTGSYRSGENNLTSYSDYDTQNNYMFSVSAKPAERHEFEIWLRYVDSLKAIRVDSYYSLNATYSYNMTKKLKLSAGVQNLLQNEHYEFRTEFSTYSAQIPTTWFAKLTYEM